jgi:hypothetical protein
MRSLLGHLLEAKNAGVTKWFGTSAMALETTAFN